MLINYNAYSDMLTQQVEMCFPFEKVFFHLLGINNLKRITEVGCGNGSFLKKLSESYPEPYYKGYDHCQELIEIAHQRSGKNLDFEIGTASSVENSTDLVILRLIVHQLEDRASFLEDLSSNLDKNSQVIIIEPYDEMFHISVNLPAFNKQLAKHREILSPNSANRNVKSYIEKEMNTLGFYLQNKFYYCVPSLLRGFKAKYYQYMKSTCLITGSGADVFKDIERWYRDSAAFVQIGLILYRFIKRETYKDAQ